MRECSDGLWARTTDESEVSDAQPFPKREDAMTVEKNYLAVVRH